MGERLFPRSEIAEAAAVILTTPGHENKEYEITAETAYSFEDIAVLLSNNTGKSVNYLKPDTDSYTTQLVKTEVPEDNAAFFAGFGKAVGHGEFDTHRSDLKKLLGRSPISLEEFL
jgi:NAD(P)H dehydrogenase (quinone)